MASDSLTDRSRSDHSNSSEGGKRKYRRTKSLSSTGGGIAAQKELDPYFKPINILVYRNGDEHDPGYVATVTRKQFRNWVSFLEYLTEKTRTYGGAVHYIYSTDGKEARHFNDLTDGGRYVATVGPFKPAAYGQKPPKYGTDPRPKWSWESKYETEQAGFLDSDESKAQYLHKRKFDGNTKDMWEDGEWDKERKRDNKNRYNMSSSQPELSDKGLTVPKPYLHRSRSSMYKLKPSMFPKIDGSDKDNYNEDYDQATGRYGGKYGKNGRSSSANGVGGVGGEGGEGGEDSVTELILVTSKGELLSLPVHGSLRNTGNYTTTNRLTQKPPRPTKSSATSSKYEKQSKISKQNTSLSSISRKSY